jgi:ubiquinone/menaquinone biosynthesis C-methylase UbiE
LDYDKTDIPERYDEGRDHGPAFLQQWMTVIATHIGETCGTVTDLGCGTGRFSRGLAESFDATVIGLDPSKKMLHQAQRHRSHKRVFYVCGRGEALPLAADSADLIFISMVFHHFTDPQVVAGECRRVLREHGHVCLRTASREQIPMYPYVPFFPASRALLEQRIPSLQSQCAVFQNASFEARFAGVVTQQIAADYSDYAGKLSTRSDSILISLPDEDFNAGINAVRSAPPAGPIVEPIDFVVFEKE